MAYKPIAKMRSFHSPNVASVIVRIELGRRVEWTLNAYFQPGSSSAEPRASSSDLTNSYSSIAAAIPVRRGVCDSTRTTRAVQRTCSASASVTCGGKFMVTSTREPSLIHRSR